MIFLQGGDVPPSRTLSVTDFGLLRILRTRPCQWSSSDLNAGVTLRDSRAVERERDAIEDYVRPRVEQDEMTSEEPITDVVRKARERGQDVGRHRRERPSFRIGTVDPFDRSPGLSSMMAAQVLASTSRVRAFLNSRRVSGVKMSPCLAPARAARILFRRARAAFLISAALSVTLKGGSPFSSSLRRLE